MISNIKKNLILKGYSFPIKILDENIAEQIYEEYKQDLKKIKSERLKFEHKFKSHLVFPWMHNLMTNNKIIEIAKQILGENILCWNSIIFFKKGGTNNFVGWHEDKTYWQLRNDNVLTFSLALTKSSKDNGCLKILKKKREVVYETKDTKNNMLARGQNAIISKDEDFDYVELSPGECSLFKQDVVHGSDSNKSENDRMLVALRYISTDNFNKNNHKSAYLVSGVDKYNFYENEPTPNKKFDKRCLLFHNKIMSKQANIFAYYKLKKYYLSFLSKILTISFIRGFYYKFFK